MICRKRVHEASEADRSTIVGNTIVKSRGALVAFLPKWSIFSAFSRLPPPSAQTLDDGNRSPPAAPAMRVKDAPGSRAGFAPRPSQVFKNSPLRCGSCPKLMKANEQLAEPSSRAECRGSITERSDRNTLARNRPCWKPMAERDPHERASLSNREIRIADRRLQIAKQENSRSSIFAICNLQSSGPKVNLPIRKRCPP